MHHIRGLPFTSEPFYLKESQHLIKEELLHKLLKLQTSPSSRAATDTKKSSKNPHS